MSFVCNLPKTTDRGLELLAAAMGLTKSDTVRELVIAAIADTPGIRDAMLADFRQQLSDNQDLRTGSVKDMAASGHKVEPV